MANPEVRIYPQSESPQSNGERAEQEPLAVQQANAETRALAVEQPSAVMGVEAVERVEQKVEAPEKPVNANFGETESENSLTPEKLLETMLVEGKVDGHDIQGTADANRITQLLNTLTTPEDLGQ